MTSGKSASEPSTSAKSPSGKTKAAPALKTSVNFAATSADQSLLAAVEQALAERDLSFSDLCKLALQQLLTPEPTVPMLALLEQQIMALQLQMMQLEQRSAASSMETAESLRQQLQDLTERVAQLERQAEPAAAPEPEIDPLLARMAPLLEEF